MRLRRSTSPSLALLALLPLLPLVGLPGATLPRASPFAVRYDPPGATTFADVACPSATTCFAVGGGAADRGAVFKSVNGGASWAREPTPQDMAWITSVTCPTTSWCLAVGAGPYQPYFLATHNGGASWAAWVDQQLWNEAVGQLVCPTTTECLATLFNGDLARSTDGGTSWDEVHAPGLASVTGLACPTASACIATGEGTATGTLAVDRSTNGGAAFATAATAAGPANPDPSVACASTRFCAVAGAGAGGATVLFGAVAATGWRPLPLPGDASPGVAIACPADGTCMVAAAAATRNLVVATTTTSGGSWSVTSLAHATDAQHSTGGLSCAARASCVAVGFGTADDATFTRQGTPGAFRRVDVPSGTGPLAGVACPTASLCVAVGTGVSVRSTNGGTSWSATARGLAATAVLQDVACPTPVVCLAVGQLSRAGRANVAVVYRSADAGEAWARVPLSPGHASLSSIACVSPSTCVAVAPDGVPSVARTTDGGASWSLTAVAGESNLQLSGVACTGTTCVAVGSDPDGGVAVVSTDGGASWSVPAAGTGLGEYLESVSCTSASACVVDGGGVPVAPGDQATEVYVTSDAGATWAPASSAPTSFDVGPIACGPAACEELATPLANYGPPVSTVETSMNHSASWSVTPLPAHEDLSDVARTPSGRWVLVGTSTLNGAVVLTSP